MILLEVLLESLLWKNERKYGSPQHEPFSCHHMIEIRFTSPKSFHFFRAKHLGYLSKHDIMANIFDGYEDKGRVLGFDCPRYSIRSEVCDLDFFFIPSHNSQMTAHSLFRNFRSHIIVMVGDPHLRFCFSKQHGARIIGNLCSPNGQYNVTTKKRKRTLDKQLFYYHY